MHRIATLVLLVGCQPDPNSTELDDLTIGLKRNVLLIIADDLGVDKVGVYAEDEADYFSACSDGGTDADCAGSIPETPTIDALAEAGVRFTHAWANPVCSPTRAGAYSGRHAFRHGVGEPVNETSDVNYLDLSETTIAEAIGGALGYRAGIFGKWHVGADGNGSLTDDAPRDQGFATHAGTLSGVLSSYWDWTKYVDGVEQSPNVTDYVVEVTATDTADWINSQNSNWLAIAAFNAPHSTHGASDAYEEPPSGCGAYAIDASVTDEALRYRAVVECLDEQIANLLGSLSRSTLARTTIIFIGDNGTESTVARGEFADGSGAKGTVYENGVRVPMIIADGYTYATGTARTKVTATGQILDPGRTVDDPVHTTDLFQTIVRIAQKTNSTGVDSVSLTPYLSSSSASAQHDTLYTEEFDTDTRTGSAAIRGAQYKIVTDLTYPDPESDCSAEFSYDVTGFYDLDADPHELDNLLGTGTARLPYAVLYSAMTSMHDEWLTEARSEAGCP